MSCKGKKKILIMLQEICQRIKRKTGRCLRKRPEAMKTIFTGLFIFFFLILFFDAG